MIDAAEVLTAHFEELSDALAGVDLAGIESAAWALLASIESLDRGLDPIPDNAPDFTAYNNARALAAAAQHRIDVMDAHLIRAQRAHAALGELLGAFEDAFAAGQQAEYLTQEIDRQILTLQGIPR